MWYLCSNPICMLDQAYHLAEQRPKCGSNSFRSRCDWPQKGPCLATLTSRLPRCGRWPRMSNRSRSSACESPSPLDIIGRLMAELSRAGYTIRTTMAVRGLSATTSSSDPAPARSGELVVLLPSAVGICDDGPSQSRSRPSWRVCHALHPTLRRDLW